MNPSNRRIERHILGGAPTVIGFTNAGTPVFGIAGGAGIVQSVIRAPESTDNTGAAPNRRVRDVADRIAYLDPDSAPLTAVLMRSNTKVATNTKYEWMEKALSARWDAINNGAGYNATATSIVVNNAKFFSVGDVVRVPRTKEIMRVGTVTVGTQTLVVVRGVDNDGVNGQAIVDKDDLQIIGNAYMEGDTSGAPKSVLESFPFNYTQIVRTPFSATGSESESENYTGPDRTRLRMEKMIEHKLDLERTLLFGIRQIDYGGGSSGSADNPRRYTGGVLYFLDASGAAKLKDFGGTVTEPEVEDFMQNVFQATAGSDSRVALASPAWCSIIDQLAAGRLQTRVGEDTYGVKVTTYISTHGQFSIVKHRLLEDPPAPTGTTPSGYGGYLLALDFPRITYRPLRNRNTKLNADIQNNDYDGWKDEYLTEAGLQIVLPQVHGVGKNATG